MKKSVAIELKSNRNFIRYWDNLNHMAKINRKSETETEDIVWNAILRRKKLGFKFTRQKPINRFIVDFYCAELSLAIEIDGSSHKNKLERDVDRDRFFKQCGILVIRYTNEDVLTNLERVRSDLEVRIKDRESVLSSPPCQGRG